MNEISKISGITYQDLVYSLRLPKPPIADDINFLNTRINYAHSYIAALVTIFIVLLNKCEGLIS